LRLLEVDPGLLGLSAPLKRGGRIPVLRRETTAQLARDTT